MLHADIPIAPYLETVPEVQTFHAGIAAMGQAGAVNPGELIADLFVAGSGARSRIQGLEIAKMRDGDVPLLRATAAIMGHVVEGTPVTYSFPYPAVWERPEPPTDGVVTRVSLGLDRQHSPSITVVSPADALKVGVASWGDLKKETGLPRRKQLWVPPSAFDGLRERYEGLLAGRKPAIRE
ncbi:MAG TPA: hypothetical protein VLF71_01325 [Candidatus Saccharimonadales bacterium]|nr:hypothetical protein [Candidatus Saccharimonadales bacterium]